MPTTIERDADVCVSEIRAERLRVHACRDPRRRAGVPRLVKPDRIDSSRGQESLSPTADGRACEWAPIRPRIRTHTGRPPRSYAGQVTLTAMSEIGVLRYPRYTVVPPRTAVPAEGCVRMTGGFARPGLVDVGAPRVVMRCGYGFRPAHAMAVAAVSMFWPTTLGTTTVCGFVGVRDAVDLAPDDDPPQAASAGMSRTATTAIDLPRTGNAIDRPLRGDLTCANPSPRSGVARARGMAGASHVDGSRPQQRAQAAP
jgi:hypothetical protein